MQSDYHKRAKYIFGELESDCDCMRELFDLSELCSKDREPLLIVGPSGSGKSCLARSIHKAGTRSEESCFVIGADGLNGDTGRSMLFGHVRGAFTGAHSDKAGLLARTAAGTLVLNDVDTLRAEGQEMLLSFLDSYEYCPVGATDARSSSARIIATTNKDLFSEPRFRNDLVYRLQVGGLLDLPLLEDRPEDVRRFAKRIAKNCESELTEGALVELESRRWPGNVRELMAIVKQASKVAKGDKITAQDLGSSRRLKTRRPGPSRRRPQRQRTPPSVQSAIDTHDGNLSRAAQALGLSRNTLRRDIKRWNLRHTPLGPGRPPILENGH